MIFRISRAAFGWDDELTDLKEAIPPQFYSRLKPVQEVRQRDTDLMLRRPDLEPTYIREYITLTLHNIEELEEFGRAVKHALVISFHEEGNGITIYDDYLE